MGNTWAKIRAPPRVDYLDLCEPAIDAFRQAIAPLNARALGLKEEWAKRLHLGTWWTLVQPFGEVKLIPLIEPAKAIVAKVNAAESELWRAVREQKQLKPKADRHKWKYDEKVGRTWEKLHKIISEETRPSRELLHRAEILTQPIRRKDRGITDDRDTVLGGQPGDNLMNNFDAHNGPYHNPELDRREDVRTAYREMYDAVDRGEDEGRALEAMVNKIENVNRAASEHDEWGNHWERRKWELNNARDLLEDYRTSQSEKNSAAVDEASVAKRSPLVALELGGMSERRASIYGLV